MSNGRPARRRLTPAQDAVARLLGPLDGGAIPGGCDTCEASQTVEPLAPGVWRLNISHEPTCPTLAAMEAHR